MKTKRQGKKEKRSKSKSDTGKKPLTMRVLQWPFRDKDEFIQAVKSAGVNLPRPEARLITAKPFRDGGGYIVDWEYAKERQLAIQVELTDEEKAEISAFVRQPFSYGQRFIDALRICLARQLNDPGLIDYAWDGILVAVRTLSQSGKTDPDGKPVAPPELNDTEENIVEALNTNTLTGEKLCNKAGYPYNSNFKSTLSSLRKRGILGNKSPGYFLEPQYRFLLDKSDQGQD